MITDYDGMLRRLKAGTLDPAAFRHRDHIGVAYEALARHEFFEAVGIITTGIRSMAERAGTVDKFNATITLAFMSVIAERMHVSRHAGANDFIARNPDLERGDALAPWYSPARLTSPLARSVVLMPDLIEAEDTADGAAA